MEWLLLNWVLDVWGLHHHRGPVKDRNEMNKVVQK